IETSKGAAVEQLLEADRHPFARKHLVGHRLVQAHLAAGTRYLQVAAFFIQPHGHDLERPPLNAAGGVGPGSAPGATTQSYSNWLSPSETEASISRLTAESAFKPKL